MFSSRIITLHARGLSYSSCSYWAVMSCRRHLLSYISKSQIPQPLIVCVPFPSVCVFALRNEMLRGSCRKIILRKTIPFGASRSSTKRDLRSLCTWSYLDDSAHSLMCFENICYKRRVCNCTFFFFMLRTILSPNGHVKSSQHMYISARRESLGHTNAGMTPPALPVMWLWLLRC